ncbi:MFS transporter [Actinoplanes sp. NEAU-A12]|uniref:MFS transporter n=1 Tax=Actinoplanes sandaracinus TaxID=3045177 RepID=A0ABT6WW63_9ACTN|nr:MFS transporter [Actinoplanes sandaracinus]MDI6103964.1 MFS transporter [Actinoplanes sandaracinus]
MPVKQVLTWATVATSTAKGVMFSVSALFFTTVAGISPATVGLGLTIAGAGAVVTAFASGRLCDRFGPRRVLIVAATAQGGALAAYCLTRDAGTFVLVACVAVGAESVQRTAHVALLARAFTGPDRVGVRAWLRVVDNVSIAAGSGLAAVALAVGSRSAYLAAVLAAAVLTLVALVPLRALPTLVGGGGDRPARGGRSPLKDRRYLTATALHAVVSVQSLLLTVGMPLWVTGHTAAPDVTVALLLLLNTGLVSLLQVWSTRLVGNVPSAGRAVFHGTVLLLAACLCYAAAGYPSDAGFAVALLVAAVVAHSLGEILSETGGWELAFEWADPANSGAYQGVSQAGEAMGQAAAPLVITSTAIGLGLPGWLLLGGVFLAAGAGTRALSARRRMPQLAHSPEETVSSRRW